MSGRVSKQRRLSSFHWCVAIYPSPVGELAQCPAKQQLVRARPPAKVVGSRQLQHPTLSIVCQILYYIIKLHETL